MIVAIIPAAGQSRRMGEPKQLLPFAGTTVLGHVVDELRRSHIAAIRIVAGHQADRLREALASRPVQFIENYDFARTDMLASIRLGLADLPPECRAILIALGDQPAITAELVNRMIDAFSSGGRGIVVPVYEGRRGHPLLFSARYCGEVLAEYEQVGLRGLLAAHADDVLELAAPTAAVLSNMNTPADYQRELARLERNADIERG